MKTIKVIAFSILVALIATGGIVAQASVVRATMPFNFTVDSRQFPSGTYEITSSLDNVIRIQNTLDPHIMAYVSVMPDSGEAHNKSVLIFEKYGNLYFLHEIVVSAVMNVSLYRSKEERQIRQQAAVLNNADMVRIAAK
jgi:hypothetical protein